MKRRDDNYLGLRSTVWGDVLCSEVEHGFKELLSGLPFTNVLMRNFFGGVFGKNLVATVFSLQGSWASGLEGYLTQTFTCTWDLPGG